MLVAIEEFLFLLLGSFGANQSQCLGSATVTKTSATQASQSTSQPPDTTAGATIPQHAESSMVGLLGFFIVGLLVL